MGDSTNHIKIGDLVQFSYYAPETYDLERKKKSFGIVVEHSEKFDTVFVYWLGRGVTSGWFLPNHLKKIA